MLNGDSSSSHTIISVMQVSMPPTMESLGNGSKPYDRTVTRMHSP